MRIFNKYLFLILVVASTQSHAFNYQKEFKEQIWQFKLKSDFYRTEGNYVLGESISSLSNGGYFQAFDNNLSTRIVLTDDIGLLASVVLTRAESYDGSFQRTSTYISQVSGGIDYSLVHNDEWDVVTEFNYILPLELIDPNQDAVIGNEGVQEMIAQLKAYRELDWFTLFGSAGYNFRGSGRASLIPWSVGLSFENDYGRNFGIQFVGFNPISDDVDVGNKTARYTTLQRTNAGSQRYYSINPRVIELNLFYENILSKAWKYVIDGSFSITGANYSAGFRVGAGISYDFDLSPARKKSKSKYLDPSKSSDQEKILKSFKEETDEQVDQKLFESNQIENPESKRLQINETDDMQVNLKPSSSDNFKVKLKSSKKPKRRR